MVPSLTSSPRRVKPGMPEIFRHNWFAPYLTCACLGLMVALSGCSGRNIKVDNPVLGAAPPRRPASGDSLASVSNNDPIQQTGSTIQRTAHGEAGPLDSLDAGIGQVAATVNGRPILAADVLERYSMQIEQARQQLPPDKFEEARRQLLQKELPGHIEQQILIDAALSQLDDERRQAVEQQLDTLFEKRIEEMKGQLGVGTHAELEAYLQASGTTLSSVRKAFADQQLAMQSMSLHSGQEVSVSRQELMAEYERRIEEFTTPAQIKWQQVWISYAKHGGKDGALRVLDAAIRELKAGIPFDDIARKYSDGVMAANGGNWDWTQRDSLADSKVAQALAELKIGEISSVIQGEKAFQLVRLAARRPEQREPFADVQSQLSADLTKKKREQQAKETLERLKSKAVVVTMFDEGLDTATR